MNIIAAPRARPAEACEPQRIVGLTRHHPGLQVDLIIERVTLPLLTRKRNGFALDPFNCLLCRLRPAQKMH